MADIYCNSNDGDNADDGSTRALAKKTAEDNGMSSAGDGALTAAGAGGRVFCSHLHAQTTSANLTLSAGTINAYTHLLSTDFSTNGSGVPDLRAGASITITAGKLFFYEGYVYTQGVDYNSNGITLATGNNLKWIFDSLTFLLTGVNTDLRLGTGASHQEIHLINTNIDLLSANNNIRMQDNSRFLWEGGSLIGNPSIIFKTPTAINAIVRNVDLSTCTNNLIQLSISTSPSQLLLERCKINASLTILDAPIVQIGDWVKLHSCDSANTTYNIIEEHYEGTIIDETTIVRTGGMSDGTTPLSLKMTTNANAIEFLQPLVSPPITKWTDRLVETTYTVEGIIDSASNLQNDEIAVEFEDSTGATVLGRITSSKLSSILGTPTDVTTSTVNWDITGMSNPNKFKLQVTFTPLKVGQVTARVYLFKPSTTAYIDFDFTESS